MTVGVAAGCGVSDTAKTREMDESSLIKELGFEANTKYASASYRKGVGVSVLILANLFLKSRYLPRAVPDNFSGASPGADLAFCMFKNERDSIEAHVAKDGASWDLLFLDLNNLQGLGFRQVFKGSWLLLPKFLFHLVRHYGVGALRTFPHPFFGYLVFRYLRDRLRRIDPRRAVVTANISHPVALGIHYAALAANLRTIYIEHAMTPRLIAKNRGYDEYLVRSPHTRELLAAEGVELDRIRVLPYWQFAQEAPPILAERIKTVGIAVNKLDAFDSIREAIESLVSQGMTCLVRVHDADKRFAKFKRLGLKSGVEISSAAGSSIQDFIRRCDLVLAGNSSVLLDCYRATVPVVYYWTGAAELFDYYGLVQHTGCPHACSAAELTRLLTR